MLYNLAQIFINCEVKLLISLRNPVDSLFSLYVHIYTSFMYDEHRNTFEKFSQHLLNNLDSEKYVAFLPENHLALLNKYFSNISIMLFEDLINDQDEYFTTLSTLLKIDKNDIKSKFLTKKLNTKRNASTGIETKYTVAQAQIIKKLRIFRKSKKIGLLEYSWRLFLLKIFKFKRGTITLKHKYPDAKLYEELIQALGIKDVDKFAKQYNLDKNKLIRYHYLSKQKPR